MKRARSVTRTYKKKRTTSVPRLLPIEWKEFIGESSTTVPSGTPGTPGYSYNILANTIAQGTGVRQRIGQQIRIKKIEIIGTWGDVLNLPQCASLVNFKQQVGAPNTSEHVGPFPLRANCDLIQFAMQDSTGGNTYRFVWNLPGYGRLVRFDPDSQTVVGDFNPQLLLTNPNATAATNNVRYIRVTFSDM